LIEPIFYRTLRFECLADLINGALAVEHAKAQGKKVQYWIRRLILRGVECIGTERREWALTVSRLLKCTSQLEELDVKPCSADIITCLAAQASISVTKLDLIFEETSLPLFGVDISSFSCLRSLAIATTVLDLYGREAPFPPFTLPNLMTLALHSHPSSGIFYSLSLSKFNNLDVVEICNFSPLTSASTHHLLQFLCQNMIQQLILNLDQPDDFARILPSITAPILLLMTGSESIIPPPSILSHLPPAVKCLHVHSEGEGEHLWPVLEELKESRKCYLECVEVLTTDPGEKFTWNPTRSGPPEDYDTVESAFLGNLLTYSIALAQRGIEIRDGNGKTIFDYYPQK
jgi:hypothetical protein